MQFLYSETGMRCKRYHSAIINIAHFESSCCLAVRESEKIKSEVKKNEVKNEV